MEQPKFLWDQEFELKVEIVKYIYPYAGAGVLLEKYFGLWLGKCDCQMKNIQKMVLCMTKSTLHINARCKNLAI